MKQFTLKLGRFMLFAAVFYISFGGLCSAALAQNDLNGRFMVKGGKGDIILTLTQAADGKVSGSMKGGDLTLTLQGFPRQTGGVLGTARTAEGQMMSYFQAVRNGANVQFDFVAVGNGGDPDFNQVNKFVFTAMDGGNTAPAPRNNAPDEAPTPATGTGGDFAGKWQGDGLIMESQRQGNDYVGNLTLNGQKMPFSASAVNGVLHGTFSVGNDRFDFQGRLVNGQLNLVSEGTTYQLTKPQPARNPLAGSKPATANPLAQKPAAKPATNPMAAKPASPTGGFPASPTGGFGQLAANGGGGATPANWKTFSHVTGLSVKYPPNWDLKDQNGSVLLTPNDVKQVGGGPSEIFILTADGANGVTSAEDPQVESYVNNFVATTFPGFSRSGTTKKIQAGAQPAVQFEWEGDSQGFPARIQVQTAIVKNYAVSLVAISTKSEIKASRDQTVRQIFSSLAAGAGKMDPQVVGKWWLYEYKGTGTTGRETKSYLNVLPDGTFLLSQNSEFSFQSQGKNQLGEQTWAGGSNAQSQGGQRGTWTASNGQILVTWADGTVETWQYRVGQAANRRLFLTGANNKTDEWMEMR